MTNNTVVVDLELFERLLAKIDSVLTEDQRDWLIVNSEEMQDLLKDMEKNK